MGTGNALEAGELIEPELLILAQSSWNDVNIFFNPLKSVLPGGLYLWESSCLPLAPNYLILSFP